MAGSGKIGRLKHLASESELTVELIELLSNVEMFEGLTHRQLRKIAAKSEERMLQQHEVLFLKGDHAEHLFLVKSGLVEVIAGAPTASGERVIRNLGLGQSVGEMSWCDRGTRSASVRAATEGAAIVSVSFEALDVLCKRNPRIGYRIFRNITSDLSFRMRQDSEKAWTGTHGP